MKFFESVDPIRYEGLDSHKPVAFRWYDADQMVAGRTMRDHGAGGPAGASGHLEQLENVVARHIDRAR
jgi:hypothetical protein